MNHLAEQVISVTLLLSVLGFAVGAGIFRFRKSAAMAGKIDASSFNETDLMVLGGLVVLYSWLSLNSLAQKGGTGLTSDAILVSLGFHTITSMLVVVLIRRRRSVSEWWNQRSISVMRACGLALGGVIAMYVLMLTLKSLGYQNWMDRLGGGGLQETVNALNSSNDPWLLAMLTFVAVVSAPLSEEILFRGYVHGVAKRFAGPWVAGICSALLFAAAHANLQALLPLFAFGCLLAWLYEKTGNLWVPIASHACFNLSAVVISLSGRSESLFSQ